SCRKHKGKKELSPKTAAVMWISISPQGRPHGGDYDAMELFDWIDSLCKRK
ncbi:MAG: hypothetical protein GX061_02190, partial [Eubacteriaceae bacterium]|nr:hypothetical protein [Eubacteriaceae bacterium]